MADNEIGLEIENTVGILLRPMQPALGAPVRMVCLQSGPDPVITFDDAAVVHNQPAIANDQPLDFDCIPDFNLVVADGRDHGETLETALRFLFVRRPAVFFVLVRRTVPGFLQEIQKIQDKTQSMGYDVTYEKSEADGLGLAIGNLRGTVGQAPALG